jgi:lipopolysaccharide transport system ATP-binding protein
LAVGDAQFQKKCLGKMQDVSRQEGRTVLFVSHNLAAIKALCSSCLLLDSGKVKFRGGTLEAASIYSKMGIALAEPGVRIDNGVVLREIKIAENAEGPNISSLHAYVDYVLSLRLELSVPKEKIGVTLTLKNEEDTVVSSICGPEEGIGWLAAKKSVHIVYDLPNLSLVPGKYSIDVELFGLGGQVQFERALEFDVQETMGIGATASYGSQHGFFRIAQGAKATVDCELAEATIT